MLLKHAALACSSEENSDKFYQDLLGLNKSEPKTLPADLSKAIFNLDAELQIINYADENIHFEMFIAGQNRNNPGQIEHLCLEVDDLEIFIEKCLNLKVEIFQIPKGNKTLIFIKDFDGNLFEIKES